MPRVQVMPLTPVTIGEHTSTPFVIVLDRMALQDSDEATVIGENIKQMTGAVGALVSSDELEVGAPITLSHEQQHELLTRAGVQQYDLAPHE